jgi:hypothetical protein
LLPGGCNQGQPFGCAGAKTHLTKAEIANLTENVGLGGIGNRVCGIAIQTTPRNRIDNERSYWEGWQKLCDHVSVG